MRRPRKFSSSPSFSSSIFFDYEHEDEDENEDDSTSVAAPPRCVFRGSLRPAYLRIKVLLVALLLGSCIIGNAAELNPEVAAWLAAQPGIQSWSADFVQTRSLKSLARPLTATGHVWFQAPNRFRWELGQPAQTIAVREPDVMLVIYPRLKRVERFPLTGEQAGPWRDALALLEAGFPRNAAELQAQYNILSQAVKAGLLNLVLQPKSASARTMIPRIAIDFDPKDYSLRATELQLADGSTMRNDFKKPELNPNIDPNMFAPEIPAEYKVVEPLKK